jgi:hypothetical protein
MGYLPKGMQGAMRRRLQEAYEEPTYEKAKENLIIGYLEKKHLQFRYKLS